MSVPVVESFTRMALWPKTEYSSSPDEQVKRLISAFFVIGCAFEKVYAKMRIKLSAVILIAFKILSFKFYTIFYTLQK